VWLRYVLRAAGRFADAEHHCQKAAENERALSVCWTDTLLRQGKADEAIRILEPVWNGQLLKMGAQNLGAAFTSWSPFSRRTRLVWPISAILLPVTTTATSGLAGVALASTIVTCVKTMRGVRGPCD
jgi:hypothetical protein